MESAKARSTPWLTAACAAVGRGVQGRKERGGAGGDGGAGAEAVQADAAPCAVHGAVRQDCAAAAVCEAEQAPDPPCAQHPAEDRCCSPSGHLRLNCALQDVFLGERGTWTCECDDAGKGA
eukprot:MONOS_15229.1-p1 / transcript=MONOS_15229.1 / gene=MONOS_15229 / organism=Monocercomonoides_exilis_PA203 / gene_product=unspecified product / transcript_product=unspecified product / location=Mono_scaffold01174:112-474(+) / protein_length=121 / sequence_SO=supercontig / SO=protein_coding / is_pseudo=false